MFEQMLKEYIIKLIKIDPDMRAAILGMVRDEYAKLMTHSVKHVIENDELVQDVIRKQATTDIWEAVEEEVDSKIENAIDNLIIRRT